MHPERHGEALSPWEWAGRAVKPAAAFSAAVVKSWAPYIPKVMLTLVNLSHRFHWNGKRIQRIVHASVLARVERKLEQAHRGMLRCETWKGGCQGIIVAGRAHQRRRWKRWQKLHSKALERFDSLCNL